MDAGSYAFALNLIHFILNKVKINGWIGWNMNQLDLCVIFLFEYKYEHEHKHKGLINLDVVYVLGWPYIKRRPFLFFL